MKKNKYHQLTDLEEARSYIEELEDKIEKSEIEMKSIIEREKEKKLILDNLYEQITLFDNDLRILYVNKATVEPIGLSTDEVLGLRCDDVFKKFNLGKPRCNPCLVREAIINGKEYKGFRKSSNGKFWFERVIPVFSHNGDGEKYIEVSLDITRQKEVEEELKRSEEKYRRIIENTKDIIYSINPDSIITFISQQVSLLKYTPQEVIGHHFEEFIHPEDLESVRRKYKKTLKTGAELLLTYRLIGKDGSVVYVEDFSKVIWDNYEVIQLTGVLRDITAKHQLENQLLQSQKMEALGTLAGGIAHDFNNILSAIMGYTELVIMDLPPNSKDEDRLNEVVKASLRAKDLVKQILTFSRQSDKERKPINITYVLKEVLKLLRASLPSTIEISQKIDCKHETIMGDPVEIHQVIMNLCTNAAQAMHEKGGKLEVKLINIDINSENKLQHPDLSQGSYIQLSVSDTGKGIDKDIIERIFDPYFTTKKKSGGTGLGLAVVHGIVESYRGAISVQSNTSSGTTFKVYFPKIEAFEDNIKIESEEHIPFGNEKILFIDDEQCLVNVNKDFLERLGYSVTTRASSIEALGLFKNQPDRFDLVITDQTMPNLTGIALAKEIINIRPDIPIILCTGFSKAIPRKNLESMGIKELILKPIVQRDLAITIRKTLDK
ncbi:PAS domain S-box protein [bacterium]|nr:PAS domain S-box protein [bacterium]